MKIRNDRVWRNASAKLDVNEHTLLIILKELGVNVPEDQLSTVSEITITFPKHKLEPIKELKKALSLKYQRNHERKS